MASRILAMALVLASAVSVACSTAPGSTSAPSNQTRVPDNETLATPDVEPTAVTAGLVHWHPIAAPAGGERAAEWLEIDVATPRGLRHAPVAVLRPAGAGPSPVVVYLHGDSGLSTAMLDWAPRLADAGFLTLVGSYKPAPAAPERITCGDCPLAQEGAAALVDLAHRLPGGRPEAVGIVGLSGGAAESLRAGRRADVRAVVADSGIPAAEDPLKMQAPALLLGFTKELAFPGLQYYERTLRDAGRPAETHFYDGTRHVTTLDPIVGADATARVIAFLRRQLE